MTAADRRGDGGVSRPAAGRRRGGPQDRAARRGRGRAGPGPRACSAAPPRCATWPPSPTWTCRRRRCSPTVCAGRACSPPGRCSSSSTRWCGPPIYDSVPPGMRAMAHARAAALLERDGRRRGTGRRCTCCAASPTQTRARSRCCAPPPRPPAAAAPRTPRPGTCAGRSPSRRPPGRGRRSCSTLASPWPATATRPPSRCCARRSPRPMTPGRTRPSPDAARQPGQATAALLCAGVLGVWGHHDSAPPSRPGRAVRTRTATRSSAEPAGGGAVRQLVGQCRDRAVRVGADPPRLDAVAEEPRAGPGSARLARLRGAFRHDRRPPGQ